MRLALAAMIVLAATLAVLPVAAAETSPYAGTWTVSGQHAVLGTDSCGSTALGEEQRTTVVIDRDGTFSSPPRSSGSRINLAIDVNGTVTLTVTPGSDGCPAWSGRGSCGSVDVCNGRIESDDGGVFTFRLERIKVAATDRTLALPAGGGATVRLSNEASLRVNAGPSGVTLDVEAFVTPDSYLLPDSKPPVPGDAIGRRYFQFESRVTSGELQSVAIAMDLFALGLPEGVLEPHVRFHYWTGTRWAELDVAKVDGQGEPDLVVLDRDVDAAAGRATLTVDHLSSYAVTLQALDAPPRTAEAPAPSVALLLLALVAVVALLGRESDGRR